MLFWNNNQSYDRIYYEYFIANDITDCYFRFLPKETIYGSFGGTAGTMKGRFEWQ